MDEDNKVQYGGFPSFFYMERDPEEYYDINNYPSVRSRFGIVKDEERGGFNLPKRGQNADFDSISRYGMDKNGITFVVLPDKNGQNKAYNIHVTEDTREYLKRLRDQRYKLEKAEDKAVQDNNGQMLTVVPSDEYSNNSRMEAADLSPEIKKIETKEPYGNWKLSYFFKGLFSGNEKYNPHYNRDYGGYAFGKYDPNSTELEEVTVYPDNSAPYKVWAANVDQKLRMDAAQRLGNDAYKRLYQAYYYLTYHPRIKAQDQTIAGNRSITPTPLLMTLNSEDLNKKGAAQMILTELPHSIMFRGNPSEQYLEQSVMNSDKKIHGFDEHGKEGDFDSYEGVGRFENVAHHIIEPTLRHFVEGRYGKDGTDPETRSKAKEALNNAALAQTYFNPHQGNPLKRFSTTKYWWDKVFADNTDLKWWVDSDEEWENRNSKYPYNQRDPNNKQQEKIRMSLYR